MSALRRASTFAVSSAYSTQRRWRGYAHTSERPCTCLFGPSTAAACCKWPKTVNTVQCTSVRSVRSVGRRRWPLTWVYLSGYRVSRACNFVAVSAYTNYILFLLLLFMQNKMWMPSTLKMVLYIVMLVLSATLARGWGINHAHPGTGAKCERLNVSFCRGLRYNLTAMPNFMGHEDQRQAERGVTSILKMLNYYPYY